MENGSWNYFYGSDSDKLNDGVLINLMTTRHGSGSSSSLVFDRERDELVEAPVKLERKGSSADKSVTALKNHSEAERRRRDRINAHLGTLRNQIRGGVKMDKATLLAEVISHLKVLKQRAAEASEDFLIPKEIDEIKVEQEDDKVDGVPYSFKASLCCDYKPGLLSDLGRALNTLHLIINRAEIATLDGRMKNVLVITSCKEDVEDAEVRQILARSVHQAIRSVMNKFSASQELETGFSKRRRISIFSSSSPSSLGDFW